MQSRKHESNTEDECELISATPKKDVNIVVNQISVHIAAIIDETVVPLWIDF